MNADQRGRYFGMWETVCRVQGWKKNDDHQRQRVTFAATGETSSTDLDEDQITLLFIKLDWLADPRNFDKALADSDPAAALAANMRKKIIWRIEKAAAKIPGDAEADLAKMAGGKCAKHGVSEWRKLPTPELLRFSYTVSSRTTKQACAKRATKPQKGRAARSVQPACTKRAEELKNPLIFTAHPNGTVYIGAY